MLSNSPYLGHHIQSGYATLKENLRTYPVSQFKLKHQHYLRVTTLKNRGLFSKLKHSKNFSLSVKTIMPKVSIIKLTNSRHVEDPQETQLIDKYLEMVQTKMKSSKRVETTKVANLDYDPFHTEEIGDTYIKYHPLW